MSKVTIQYFDISNKGNIFIITIFSTIVMIIVICRGNILDKYREQMKEHRLFIILGFRIYILYKI